MWATDNYDVSPDGTINASRFLTTSTGAYLYLSNINVSNSTVYTISVYAKSNGNNLDDFRIYTNLGDSSTLTATSEWQRFTYTFTTSATQINVGFRPSGTQNADIQVFGYQLEQQSYATSYIPTSGTTVTRAADSANGAGDASTFNSEQGILFLEVAALVNDATVRLWSVSNGTTLNRVFLGFGGASNNIRFRVQVANVYQAEDDTTISDVTDFNKIALLYKENNFKLYINGSLALSDTSGSTFTSGTLDRFNFDSAAGSSIPYSKCKDLRYYDTEGMTDTEIDNLLTQLTQ